MTVASIRRDELAEALARRSVTVVDALPAHVFSQRHLPGAINVVAEHRDEEVAEALPDLEAPVVVYSTDENCDRAPALAHRPTELGYRNVRLLRAGIADWVAHGRPVAQGPDHQGA